MPESPEQRMIHEVGEKQERILRAQKGGKSPWSALTILGVIGWSIVVPTLIGVACGVWLDRRWPQSFSWAVTLLVVGLMIGCVSAWLRIRE